MNRTIQMTEGLCFFLTALYFYNFLQGNWILFIALLFVPDISMIGYLKGSKVGALIYNLFHTYILALLVILVGVVFLQNNLLAQIGIILFAHVSIDRFFGYGLKEFTGFKHTHLGKIGK